MGDLLTRMKRWWASGSGRSGPAPPFEVVCACGRAARGLRRARYQVVRCAGCGAALFVLGHSPLPPRRTAAPPGAPAAYWRGPLVAAGLTLIVVVAVFAVLLGLLVSPRGPAPDTPREELDRLVRAGRQALAEEKFQLAVRDLQRARELSAGPPPVLSPAEARALSQLHRQAALLSDLLRESLGEILQVAAGVREDEWQAQFATRYRDRAVVFDDVVRRDAAGDYHLAVYEVRASGEPVRLDFRDLKLLAALPLEQPQRLLFGARLSEVGREAPGTWVIRFAPDSGVLLTDEGAAGACCPQPLGADLEAVLRRQAEWAAALSLP